MTEWIKYDTYKGIELEASWCEGLREYHYKGLFDVIGDDGKMSTETLIMETRDELYDFIDGLLKPTPIHIVSTMLARRRFKKNRQRVLREAAIAARDYYEKE